MFKKLPAVIKLFIGLVIINSFIFSAYNCFSKTSQIEESPKSGEAIFQVNCSGCHINGQNLIKSDKPVIGSKMLKSKQLFKTFLDAPPQPMPNFKNITGKPEKLNALYNYVVSLMGK